jgi:hypothetical protein
MKQLKSRWPAVYVRVPPELHARIEAEAGWRGTVHVSSTFPSRSVSAGQARA